MNPSVAGPMPLLRRSLRPRPFPRGREGRPAAAITKKTTFSNRENRRAPCDGK